MGFFDGPLFDFNGDGRVDGFETFVGLQVMASSRQEAIDLTGDDSFYLGSDKLNEDERRRTLNDAGFDADDFDD